MSFQSTRILILGGGFAGVMTAICHDKMFSRPENVEITLVSDENFLLFTPMLPEGASRDRLDAGAVLSARYRAP